MELENRSLLSSSQLSRSDIETLIDSANQFAQNLKGSRQLLGEAIVGLMFFQESVRTRLGFESAAYRLGAQVLNLDRTKFQDSMTAAESTEDATRVLNGYADILCVRHPQSDIFSRVLPIVDKPVINAGNGDDEHPTQALIDLLAIYNNFGRIDGLNIALIGDSRFMRATHSLALALAKFDNVTIRDISPEELRLPERYKTPYTASGNIYVEAEEMDLDDTDVVYVGGFAPKTPIGFFEDHIRSRYQINNTVLERLKDSTIVLCPLPRIDEITTDVDSSHHARYFQQSDQGLFMRMAILAQMTQ